MMYYVSNSDRNSSYFLPKYKEQISGYFVSSIEGHSTLNKDASGGIVAFKIIEL